MPEPSRLSFGELPRVRANKLDSLLPARPRTVQVGQQFAITERLAGLTAELLRRLQQPPNLVEPSRGQHPVNALVDAGGESSRGSSSTTEGIFTNGGAAVGSLVKAGVSHDCCQAEIGLPVSVWTSIARTTRRTSLG